MEQELFRTPAMLERIADLYSHIFLFLASVMDFLMKKRVMRMLDSLNENFGKRFDDEIRLIRQKAELIRNLAAQSSHAELRVTRLAVEATRRDVRIGLEADACRQAELQYLAERIESELAEAKEERQQSTKAWQQLAGVVQLMLQDRAETWIIDTRASASLDIHQQMLASGAQSPLGRDQSPRRESSSPWQRERERR